MKKNKAKRKQKSPHLERLQRLFDSEFMNNSLVERYPGTAPNARRPGGLCQGCGAFDCNGNHQALDRFSSLIL
jgi:hypothetical protein